MFWLGFTIGGLVFFVLGILVTSLYQMKGD
jgi:hypothetical protein